MVGKKREVDYLPLFSESDAKKGEFGVKVIWTKASKWPSQVGKSGILTRWEREPTIRKTRENILFMAIVENFSLSSFKTTCVYGQLPSEVSLWCQRQKQFMQNSNVCTPPNVCIPPTGERHPTTKNPLWNKAFWSRDADHLIEFEESAYFTVYFMPAPFSLISHAQWKHWFLGYLIGGWFECFSSCQQSYIMIKFEFWPSTRCMKPV